jgi:expansin (peptidoglycan-binding protein)
MRARTLTKRARIGLLVAALAVVAVACGPTTIVPGKIYKGEGTYYAGDGSGNCSFPAGGSVLYAAMNNTDYGATGYACGAWVEATGPKGKVTVQIVDRCPECAIGDIDFSPQAFDTIANHADGRVPISWKIVSAPASVGNLQFVVKDGSNQWWIGIQVRQHANIITKMEALVGGTWKVLERQQYNYFLATSGLGVGPFTVRVTDYYGQVLTKTGITLSPEVVQSSTLQFTRH